MKELAFDELKSVALEVLCEIDKICVENGFTYSLAYGTLLGAVRHKGFIPWDDDIDIMMPRADYSKFIEYCQTHETSFKLASVETDPTYGYLFAKACDTKTVLTYENTKWNHYGIQVDIFPVDNLGSSLEEAKAAFKARRFQRELLVAWNWTFCKLSKNKSLTRNLAKLVFFVLSRFVSNKALSRSVNQYYKKINANNYVGIMCGAYRMREIMPCFIYDSYTTLPFEGKNFKAITNYKDYLTTVYGDYMQLPPEEERVPRHSFKVYWK